MTIDTTRRLDERIPVSVSPHAAMAQSLAERRAEESTERLLSRVMERLPSSSSASWSCQTYDRLLAGELVS